MLGNVEYERFDAHTCEPLRSRTVAVRNRQSPDPASSVHLPVGREGPADPPPLRYPRRLAMNDRSFAPD